MSITFIGGGNMATALISGLRKAQPGLAIRVCDVNTEALQKLADEYDVETSTDAAGAARGADVIVLAIKPQVMPLVLDQLQGQVGEDQLVLSIAAGTTISSISATLGPQQAVIRSMPNTPALLGKGITGMYASASCSDNHRRLAEQILATAGAVVWVDREELMDAVTAISGSGPAYIFLLAEALAAAGERLGLPADTAARLAGHTCEGAGAMLAQALLNNGADARELRRRVTSPGGTTQAAIESFQSNGFEGLVDAAAQAARDRGRELAGEAS